MLPILSSVPNGDFMAKAVEKRIGGRGCPSCGSHDTEGLSRTGAQWCQTCNHRWTPCSAHCRGYRLNFDGDIPTIDGCKDCGVPNKIARWWPESYRAMSLKLAELRSKMDAVTE